MPCAVKTCELLADNVHTMYMIIQWFRTPFDDRNNDVAFLHRDVSAQDKAMDEEWLVDDEEGDNGEDEEDLEEDGEEEEGDAGNGEGTVSNGVGVEGEAPGEKSDGGEGVRGGVDGVVSIALPTSEEGTRPGVLTGTGMDQNMLEGRPQEGGKPRGRGAALPEDSVGIKEGEDEGEGEGEGGFDDSGEEGEGDVELRRALVQDRLRRQHIARIRRLKRAQISTVCSELRGCKQALWDIVVQSLTELFRAVTLPATVPVEDFLALSWTTLNMVAFGKEFCGADSQSLLTCLRRKSQEYVAEVHKENFRTLRVMVESESWKSVPVRLGDLGGILGVVRSNLQKDGRSRLRDQVRVRGMLIEAYKAQKRRNESLSLKFMSPGAGSGGSLKSLGIIKGSMSSSLLAAPDANDNSASKTAEVDAAALGPVESDSLLHSFSTYGNPFHLMQEDEDSDARSGFATNAASGSLGGHQGGTTTQPGMLSL